MKLVDILNEKLGRVPDRPGTNPMMDASDVVKAILGDKVTSDDEDLKPGMIYLSRSWTGYPMFSTMDEDPGKGGAIGLVKLYSSTPQDVATAAHEAFHALMQLKQKNYQNEHVVNRLASRWLQDHFSGMFLHAALETINKSKISYKRKKYASTKAFLADYNKRFKS